MNINLLYFRRSYFTDGFIMLVNILITNCGYNFQYFFLVLKNSLDRMNNELPNL